MPEITEKYLRLPQHPGKPYTATRHGTLSASDGIDALYGQAAGASTWEIQTLLFRRDRGWTWEKVRTWIHGHATFTMPETLQEDFADLLGVEVFRPGTWKGVPYKNEDMERIATNSNAMLPYFQAKLHLSPVKLTHEAEQPDFIKNAALGIATKYYTQVKNGLKRVYADFRNVPNVLAKAIEQFYPDRSVEKYRYFPHPDTNEPIPDVIKGVAFLGHTPPAVKGMFNDFAVLYETEQEHSDLVDCYAWRVTDDPADVVSTQDFDRPHNPTESPKREAPLDDDPKEETMPEEQKILIQEQPKEDASPDKQASVEEAVKSDVQDEDTLTAPKDDAPEAPPKDKKPSPADEEASPQDTPPEEPSEAVTPPPQGFSEEELDKVREQARQEAADAYAEEKAQDKAKIAQLEAQNFEAAVDHYLEDLHLPESFSKLGVKPFLMSLDRVEIHQFAEDGPEHSQFDQAKALFGEIQKHWEIYRETLSSEQAPEESDRRRNQEQQRAQLFKELREDQPQLPETEIMKLAAEQRPELFEDEKEEVA